MRRYTLLDVFTSTRLQGNPLAVVHDADGLSDAVMHAVARARGDEQATYTQQTHAGLQPIEVQAGGDGVYHASMLQEPAEFGPEVDPSDVLGAVGLSEDDRDPELPCQAVSTGAWQLLAPVRNASLLAGLWPDYDRISGLLAPYPGGLCLYVVAVDLASGTARARSYGALAEREGMRAVTVSQGVEMGRASRLVCELEGDRVRVGGDAVVVADGSVVLDT